MDRRKRIEEDLGRGGCGVVALTELDRPASHAVVADALTAISCMEHRGGCIGDTGDGAGLLLDVQRSFFDRFLPANRRLPEGELLVVGLAFFLRGERNPRTLQREVDLELRSEGLAPLGWRKVPVEPEALGEAAREDMPKVYQVFVGRGHRPAEELEEVLAHARRRIEDTLGTQVKLPALNARTTVYKALATGAQLGRFYPDLTDPELVARVAVGHRRYSTNTFSNWHLVQPFRLLAHNGEINTISANARAVRDVERVLGVQKVFVPNASDSALLDRAVELVATTRAEGGLPEAMRRLVPPVYRGVAEAQAARFFEASQRVLGTLGAWEGPAALLASDGRQLVAMLDRMGLRPLRWALTRERRLIVASEMGAVPLDPTHVVSDGQLEPGELLLADLEAGELIEPERSTAWILDRADPQLRFGDLSTSELVPVPRAEEACGPLPIRALNALGWNRERVQRFKAVAKGGKEAVHSMGNDRPLAIFSEDHPRLFSYLNQIVAVVTNPPIDPLREGAAMDLTVYLGRSPFLGRRGEYRIDPQYKLEHPILTNPELNALRTAYPPSPRVRELDASVEPGVGADGLSERIHELAREGVEAIERGEASILLISDRRVVRDERLPVPTLLLVGALHRGLSRAGVRRNASLVVESGAVLEGHDVAVLLAYGATAVNPYALLAQAGEVRGVEPERARQNVIAALLDSLRRIMSKMGITTMDGYRGSALFEAVALSPEVVDYYLPGTETNVGGATLADLYADLEARAAGDDALARPESVNVFRKEVTHELQMVARNGDREGNYQRLSELLDATPPVYLRDLVALQPPAEGAVPLEQVAPAQDIVRDVFRGAAMSHGALHATAHRAIAAAFNQLGAASNSGEGGEDPRRNPGGPWSADRNRIRQVASGRFGVDAAYLVGADQLEIKIGQGAKPGEGGFLPAHKVTAEIARIRKTQEGVPLISPPPHHDIYSIEDLAQLIRNLREVSPRARIGVKVPAVTNLGTIAVGVAKAGADVITISGCTGGTGAAYSGSIFHAGLPLERGLSEAHQYLVANGLRDRVQLCADGGIKYGLDVAKVLALGADLVGFGTALLVAENCVFCRGCNHGNCPVGITTQDETKQQKRWMVKHNADLKEVAVDARYAEARDGVVRYLTSVAEHLRRLLGQLGLQHPRELVGRVDLLEQVETGNPRWDRLDLRELLLDLRQDPSEALCGPTAPITTPAPRGARASQAAALNDRLLTEARVLLAAEPERPARIGVDLSDQPNEALGATLAGAIASGDLPHGGRIVIEANGFAGQGFGFAATDGMTLRLRGYANDGVGEALSGDARIVITPPPVADRATPPHLVGNAVAYGATGGRLFVAGRAGQRFGVRNSGAALVAEGVGEYAFEYMTGGLGVVLGACGGCFGSGLTGGRVAVLDAGPRFAEQLSPDVALRPDGPWEELHTLLTEFAEETQSPTAQTLLDDWDAARARFAWVVPQGAPTSSGRLLSVVASG